MVYSNLNTEEALRAVRYLARGVFSVNPGSSWVRGESIASKREGEKDESPAQEDTREMSQAIINQGIAEDEISSKRRRVSTPPATRSRGAGPAGGALYVEWVRRILCW